MKFLKTQGFLGEKGKQKHRNFSGPLKSCTLPPFQGSQPPTGDD